MASQSTLLGAAGEHLVMSELLRHNFIAALALMGVPNVDIIVADIKGALMLNPGQDPPRSHLRQRMVYERKA